MERTELAALAAEGYALYAAEAAEFAEVSAEANAEAWAADAWVREVRTSSTEWKNSPPARSVR